MKAIQIGICILAAFSVFAHGAVEPWSEAVLAIGAAGLIVFWGLLVIRRGVAIVRWNPLLWPLLGLGGFVLLQYFARLSVYPYLTKVELLKFAAYGLLFFLAVQGYRTLPQWQGFTWFLLVLGFVVSVFGILQHFTFNGKLYWLRELRYGGIPFGPYVNRNHFAGLVELIVPSGLAILVLRGARRDQLPLVTLFTLLPIGALFLSASRGGMISFLVEIALLAILVAARYRERRSLVAGTVVLMLAAALVGWLGIGPALERFARLQSLEVSEARRLAIAQGTWRIFLDRPWAGTGLGTFIAVYPRYETLYDGKVVNHAHNDYLELLSETGLPGALLFLAFLLLLVRQFWLNVGSSRSPNALALHLGSFVACMGLLVHGLSDFNLHIPSNALLFYLQAALASTRFEAGVNS